MVGRSTLRMHPTGSSRPTPGGVSPIRRVPRVGYSDRAAHRKEFRRRRPWLARSGTAATLRDRAQLPHARGRVRLCPPPSPAVFTKLDSSIARPYGEVELPDGDIDWEVELVAVIGRRAYQVQERAAWTYVAGLTAGQDISDAGCRWLAPSPSSALPSPIQASLRWDRRL